MTGGPELPAAIGGTQNPAEDTVELELTAEEQLELARAAAAAPAPDMARGKPEYDRFVCRRTDRVDFVCTVTFAALVVGVTALSGWRAVVGHAPPPAVAAAALPAPAPAPPEQPPPPVVQVMNPFDATEVFEFPADTTATAARDAIAEVLLQRARERYRQGLYVRRASNRQPTTPIATDIPQDAFVTRLSGPANEFAGTASLRAEGKTGE